MRSTPSAKSATTAATSASRTLNALLSEMSGFGERDGVVVVAATNRLDTLDEALLRAGRFDRQIEVPLPGLAERLRILEVHARGKPLAQDVSLEALPGTRCCFPAQSWNACSTKPRFWPPSGKRRPSSLWTYSTRWTPCSLAWSVPPRAVFCTSAR